MPRAEFPSIRAAPPANAERRAPGSRGKALIVDDEITNCRLLSQMLRREGFTTAEAYNGAQALSMFGDDPADIVFMDVMMPEMDGLETTRALKRLAGASFVPVIFLTALRDEPSLIRCTEAGGDDFLSKPFSLGILKARILAMERVRDLQRTVAAKNRALSTLIETDREEQALAERIFSHAVSIRNVALDRINLIQRPAAMFSGDLVLTQYLPDGSLRLLLGDFTGHGLAAAIGALPVADAFRTMTIKGVCDLEVLTELNRKLYQMLPADRFMAACLVTISSRGDELRWWNGGLPSGWLRRADELVELPSHTLPLGILRDLIPREAPRRLPLRVDDRLLLMTDGLPEASDRAGRQFADAGLRELLNAWPARTSVIPTIAAALDQHGAGAEQTDDIAVVEVPLDRALFEHAEPGDRASPQDGWHWSLEVTGQRLGTVPILADALRPIGLLDGLQDDIGALQTIVAELYANALEHGVLGLDSRMKATPDGFDAYYRARAERLARVRNGRIRLALDYEPAPDAGRLLITVTNSGAGFDPTRLLDIGFDPARPWGRGLALVRDLCKSLSYHMGGTEARALYRCSRT